MGGVASYRTPGERGLSPAAIYRVISALYGAIQHLTADPGKQAAPRAGGDGGLT